MEYRTWLRRLSLRTANGACADDAARSACWRVAGASSSVSFAVLFCCDSAHQDRRPTPREVIGLRGLHGGRFVRSRGVPATTEVPDVHLYFCRTAEAEDATLRHCPAERARAGMGFRLVCESRCDKPRRPTASKAANTAAPVCGNRLLARYGAARRRTPLHGKCARRVVDCVPLHPTEHAAPATSRACGWERAISHIKC